MLEEAQAASSNENWANSDEIYQSVIRDFPKSQYATQAKHGLAGNAFSTKNFDKAAQYWKELQTSPKQHGYVLKAYYNGSLALHQAGKDAECYENLVGMPAEAFTNATPAEKKAYFELAALSAQMVEKPHVAALIYGNALSMFNDEETRAYFLDNLAKVSKQIQNKQDYDNLLAQLSDQEAKERLLASTEEISELQPEALDVLQAPENPHNHDWYAAPRIGLGLFESKQSNAGGNAATALNMGLRAGYKIRAIRLLAQIEGDIMAAAFSKSTDTTLRYAYIFPHAAYDVHISSRTRLRFLGGFLYSTIFGAPSARYGFQDAAGPETGVSVLYWPHHTRRVEFTARYGIRGSDTSKLQLGNRQMSMDMAFYLADWGYRGIEWRLSYSRLDMIFTVGEFGWDLFTVNSAFYF